MLSRLERIKYRGLFLQAYQKGQKLNSANLRLVFTPTRSQEQNRLPLLGLTISKKFSKKAVVRNKIRRRLREIYRLYRLEPANRPALQKIGILIICVNGSYKDEDLKDQTNQFSYHRLQEELLALLAKFA